MKFEKLNELLNPKPEPKTPMTLNRFIDLLGDSNRPKPMQSNQRTRSTIEFADHKK